MIALREFAYLHQATGKSVRVRKGETIDQATLAQNKVDLDKLARVRFVGQDEAGAVTVTAPPRKRGRPRKQP